MKRLTKKEYQACMQRSKSNNLYCRYVHTSEEEAKGNAMSNVIATVKIEWEE